MRTSAMTSILTCPGESELLALAMREPAAAAVVAHVDECASFKAKRDRFQAEVGLLRASGPEASRSPRP
jgi:hypothetical protein